MCMHLYTYIYLPLPLAWVRLENQRPVTCYVTVTLMTFDMQSNGRRIEVESYSCKHGVSNSFPAGTRTPDPQRPQVAQPAAVLAIVPCVHFADHAASFIDPRTASAVFIDSSDRQLSHRRMHSVRQSRRTGTSQAWQILPTEWINEWMTLSQRRQVQTTYMKLERAYHGNVDWRTQNTVISLASK